MFSVVEVSGPVFYLDWTGRRVEVRANDSLTADDMISSISGEDIKLKTLDDSYITLRTGEPSSISELLRASSSSYATPVIDSLAENQFNGTMIQDDGIGAAGKLTTLDMQSIIPAQESQGKYGVLNISETGTWFYRLSEEAMDGELTSKSEQVDDSFHIEVEKDDSKLKLELKLFLQGTDDIPDILDSQLSMPSIPSRSDLEKKLALAANPLRKTTAEHELMSMIGDLLMTG